MPSPPPPAQLRSEGPRAPLPSGPDHHHPLPYDLLPYPLPLCFTAKIITGSFQGNLRIYKVKERDFKPEDLLLEQQLEGPILQVATGHFSS